MKRLRAKKRYEEQKRPLLGLGFVRPGSIVRRFMKCGKKKCRCKSDPSMFHGPYYQWTHKVRGRTVTRVLDPKQAKACAKWVENHRRLKVIIRRMEDISLRETDRLLAIW